MLQDLSYYEMENCPAFMDIAEELKDIVGRIGHGVHTDADLQRLQEIIETRGTRSVVVNVDANEASIIAVDGRAIVHIPAQGDEFQAGDFSYPGAEVVRSILESISPPINPNLYGDVNGTSIIIGNGDVTINSLEITGDANESVIITGNNNNVNSGIVPPRKEKIDWQKSSRTRLKEQLQLTTNPLTQGRGIGFEVEQVYVPLGLLERKKQPIQRKDITPEDGSDLGREMEISRSTNTTDREPQVEITEFFNMLPQGQSPESQGKLITIIGEPGAGKTTLDREPQVEITKRFEHDEFLNEVFRQGQSPKSQGKRIAIIGEPGAGKTTLLQQIARWIERTFPSAIVIWVSLGDLKQDEDLETHLETKCLKSLVDLADRGDVSTARKDFDTHLQQGQVWLLLDGLDEMKGSNNPLSAIQRQIQEGGLLPQMRIVMTCRLNLWDGDRNGLETFDTYRTLEFAYPQQVEMFIEKWFAPRGTKEIEKGNNLCKALKAAGSERIRDLMKNPLRLSLMCFSWFSRGGKLPKTQAELYQRFVERIYEWKQEQFPTTTGARQQLNRQLAELSKAAIDDGDEEGQGRFRLRHDFVKKYLDRDIPQGNGTFLDLALRLGWLNQVGLDAENLEQKIYAFFHPTFQEYFAALSIDDERFFLTLVPEKLLDPLDSSASYRVFETQWRQVFLLWLGRKDLNRASKEALIQTLMKFEDRCGDFYTDRAFLLAAVGIAEFKDCKQADAIVDKLVQWKFPSLGRPSPETCQNHDRKAARVEWATNTFSRTDSQRVIRSISQVLKTTLDDNTRRYAAESLGKIDPGNDTAIHSLIKLLETTQNDYTREYAAESLGKIGTGNETAIQALAKLLETTQNESTRWKLAEILGKIGTGNDTAIHSLVELLETTQNDNTRRYAAKILVNIGTGNETAIQALVGVLKTTQNNYSHKYAAEILGKISTDNNTAIHSLVKLLETTQNDNTRKYAAEILVNIGTGNDTAIHSLAELLETTQNDNTRRYAAKILVNIGTGNATAIKVLVKLLEITLDDYIREKAAESLGNIDPGNDIAIHSLTKLLETTLDDYIREKAAESLGNIATGNDTAIHSLAKLLETTLDHNTRRYVAESLGKIGTGNDTAIHSLTKLLETTQNDDTRWIAAESLGNIDPGNDTAIHSLTKLLETTLEDNTRWIVATSLGKIGTGNDTAIHSLAKLLETTLEDNTRWIAAKSLGNIGTGNDTAIHSLTKLLETTQNDDNRWIAAKILGKIGTGNDTAIHSLVKLLETTQNDNTRKYAAEILGNIGTGNDTAIHSLAKLLETTQNDNTRKYAAEILGNIGTGNDTAIHSLVKLLETTQNNNTRWRVAEILGNIGTGNDTAIHLLVKLLETTQNDNTRKYAAEILGNIGTGNDTAIHSLAKLLATTLDDYIRWRVAESLGKIGTGNDTAIHSLVKLLETTQNDNTRKYAAKILVKIGTGNDTAIHSLAKLLETTQNDNTREYVAEILGKIDPGNATAIKVLVRSLRSNLRYKEGIILMMKFAESLSYRDFYRAFHAPRQ